VTSSKSNALQAKFSSSTLVATNPAFPPPSFLGANFNPGTLPEDTDLINVNDGAGAEIWYIDWRTKELTVTFANGVTPTIFWDQFHNVVVFVTDVLAFQADAGQNEPPNKQPQAVRLYLTDN